MKKEDRDVALNPTQYRTLGSDKKIDLRTLDETDEKVFNTVYYKEVPVVTGSMDETVIVTYSPKYKAYQQKIRNRQIERAEQMISSQEKKEKEKIKMIPLASFKKLPSQKMGNLQVSAFTAWTKTVLMKKPCMMGFMQS